MNSVQASKRGPFVEMGGFNQRNNLRNAGDFTRLWPIAETGLGYLLFLAVAPWEVNLPMMLGR